MNQDAHGRTCLLAMNNVTRFPAHAMPRRASLAAAPAVRRAPAATVHEMEHAVGAMIASCERYASAYAGQRRRPIGCDATLGPILLDVLRGIGALTADGDLRDRVGELVSRHALDLEE